MAIPHPLIDADYPAALQAFALKLERAGYVELPVWYSQQHRSLLQKAGLQVFSVRVVDDSDEGESPSKLRSADLAPGWALEVLHTWLATGADHASTIDMLTQCRRSTEQRGAARAKILLKSGKVDVRSKVARK